MQQQQPAHFHPNYAVAYEDINPSSTFYYGHQQQGQLQYQQQQQLQQQVSMTPVAHNMNIVDTLLYDVEEQQPAPAFTHMVTPSHANKQSSRKDNRKRPKRKQVKNACVNCQKACKKCDDGRPCQRCIKLGLTATCVNSPRKERKKGVKRGPYKKRQQATAQQSTAASSNPPALTNLDSSDSDGAAITPSPTQFYCPDDFRQQPSLITTSPPLLLQQQQQEPSPLSVTSSFDDMLVGCMNTGSSNVGNMTSPPTSQFDMWWNQPQMPESFPVAKQQPQHVPYNPTATFCDDPYVVYSQQSSVIYPAQQQMPYQEKWVAQQHQQPQPCQHQPYQQLQQDCTSVGYWQSFLSTF